MDPKDVKYLSFLENYDKKTQTYIQPTKEEETNTVMVQQQDVSKFPADIQRIREILLETSSQLYYVSESEQKYEFIFIPNETITELPKNCTEFKSLVKQNNLMLTAEEELSGEESDSILRFQEFFDNFTSDYAEDPYGQKEGYKELQKIVEATFHGKENVKIYKIGDFRRIGVYIVGLIKGVGVVGLKTISIET
jgi:hypothetical protein